MLTELINQFYLSKKTDGSVPNDALIDRGTNSLEQVSIYKKEF